MSIHLLKYTSMYENAALKNGRQGAERSRRGGGAFSLSLSPNLSLTTWTNAREVFCAAVERNRDTSPISLWCCRCHCYCYCRASERKSADRLVRVAHVRLFVK